MTHYTFTELDLAMEAAKVLRMVHMLSERCLFDQEVHKEGLKSIKGAVKELKGVEEAVLSQTRLLEEWLNETERRNSVQPSVFAMDEDKSWFSLRVFGEEFNDLIALSLIVGAALVLGLLPWVICWVGHCRQRRRIKDIAQAIRIFNIVD